MVVIYPTRISCNSEFSYSPKVLHTYFDGQKAISSCYAIDRANKCSVTVNDLLSPKAAGNQYIGSRDPRNISNTSLIILKQLKQVK